MTPKVCKTDFTITGFILAIIVISMFAGMYGVLLTQMDNAYSRDSNSSLSDYDIKSSIDTEIANINNSISTDVEGGNIFTDFVDIVGAFFAGGWSAVKTSFNSMYLFGDMLNDASNDVEAFAFFRPYIFAIILIMIFMGVAVGALLKHRI